MNNKLWSDGYTVELLEVQIKDAVTFNYEVTDSEVLEVSVSFIYQLLQDGAGGYVKDEQGRIHADIDVRAGGDGVDVLKLADCIKHAWAVHQQLGVANPYVLSK